MVRIRSYGDVFSFLMGQARSKKVRVSASFRSEIMRYVRSLRDRKAREIYPKLREMREPYESLIMSVIGYRAIVLADKRGKPVNAEIVRMAIDELRKPERHEPEDPDDTCRKTAAINIMQNREEFRDSLPSRLDFGW